ncbi:Alkylated DNA repair protein ALKBH8 homolog (Alpha-ketoglutarate-dependent dioxygenase ALKBH8 homolog) (AtALKBH8) [Durusdinium trenchii]|uniref:Alkylated DNA repair protein ALKBH8 homolog (Alpha-ketoglutarate-dependent dioxygenase ALKBH8 homolog) (AtALKBH8) n=1 Tax=Durusdinium trenchii TaxID=1381693 RepID=A0ABP0NPX4_9DINO
MLTLDPTRFRRPKNKAPTRHLYLANCGQQCGDTAEEVLRRLREGQAEEEEVVALHLGPGVTYASFVHPTAAARAKAQLEFESDHAWRVKFAELEDEVREVSGVLLPSSVESTAHVEVPGVHVVTDFVSEMEAQELLLQIDQRPWNTSIKRRVQHYGRAFDYAKLMIADPGTVPEMPDFCQPLLQRLEQTALMPHRIDQLTVNEYEAGIGIAAHVDAHSAFEDTIAAVSLHSGIVMEFRKPEPDSSGKVSMGKHHRMAPATPSAVELTKNVWLPPNSLLIITGEARYAWLHGIAWRKTDCVEEGKVIPRQRRVSLTFRRARGTPCACPWPTMCDSQTPEAHGLPSRIAQ